MRSSIIPPRSRAAVVLAFLVVAVVASGAALLGRALAPPAPLLVETQQLAPATSTVQPSTGLYWTSNVDPTIGAGVNAPLWQLLFRTDVPSIYVKTGTATTAWTLLGNGTPSTPQTTINPRAYYYGYWSGDGVCSSATQGCRFFDNGALTAATLTSPPPTTSADLGVGEMCVGSSGVGGGFLAHGLSNTTSGQGVQLGTYAFQIQFRPKISLVGVAGDLYTTRIGLANWGGNGNTTKEANGVWAVVDHTQGDFWGIEACKANVCTLSVCDGAGGRGTANFAAATYYLVEIDINAAGTTASLSVNGNAICTSVSTNMPIVPLSSGFHHTKTSNTNFTNPCLDLNWYQIFAPVNRP